MNVPRLFCLIAASAAVVCASPAYSAMPDYHMGPQDKLKVRVYDWRTGTDDTHEWPALTGEFTVGASGNVSFPIVGDLQAQDKTPSELALSLASKLQEKVGLAQSPYASVEVETYRPFYILGALTKPGEYPFRPGLTVLQAVGIAGGMDRLKDTSALGLERDTLASRGELRVISSERLQLLARQARLQAETADATTIAWPSQLADQASDVFVSRTMREEQLLLQSYRSSIQAQIANATQTKVLLREELASLKTKNEVLSRQMSLAQAELDLVSSLVARGLASTPRQMALQQNQAQFESARTDLELTSVRARQDSLRADRDAIDFQNKMRSQVLTDLGETRIRLAGIAERIASLNDLIYESEVRAPTMLSTERARRRLSLTYKITRLGDDGVNHTFPVQDSDLVLPGDTVQVDQLPGDAPSEDSARQ